MSESPSGAGLSGSDSKPTAWATEDFIRTMPKAEVHVHLEGCFEVADLVDLADAASVDLPRPPESLFDFEDFDGFLRFLDWQASLVRTADQVARTAYRFAERESRSGVRYADLIVNLTHWGAWSQDLKGLIDALDAGFREAEEDGLAKVGLCLSLLRQQSAEEAAELVDWMIELRHPRIVALSVDGNEAVAGRTGPRFADAFRRAEAAGLKRTVHAGESSGPEGIRDAIDLLKANRIDHGVRAIEDQFLVDELADRGIPLDMCVKSNLILGLADDRETHPLDELRTAGVKVSLNTDDPAFCDTSLEHEYAAMTHAYSWSMATLKSVAATAIEASFADEDTRKAILTDLGGWGLHSNPTEGDTDTPPSTG